MPGLDALNQLNVTTREYIRKSPTLTDLVFNQDGLNYFLRQNLKEEFTGGTSIDVPIITDVMIGGGYPKGKQFNVTQRQTERRARFDIKLVQVSVPLYMEDFKVFNKGPLAAVNLLKARVDQAYMALGAFVSIGTYLEGGTSDANYINNINGLPEALNDGVHTSWDNKIYTTYGQLTRATFAPSLDSVPTDLAGGALEYNTLDAAYYRVFYGSGEYEPNLLVTTPIGFSLLKAKFQTQQRFQDVTLTAPIGFRGMSFNGANVIASRYCPGSYLTGPAGAGTADKAAVTYLTETTAGAVVAYPVGDLGNSGESLFILNARSPFLQYFVSNDELYGGGFRDFIPSGGNTVVIGQVLLAHSLVVMPRYHSHIYAFAS